jgi:hypothetical protein
MSFSVPNKSGFKDKKLEDAFSAIEGAINSSAKVNGIDASGVAPTPNNSGSIAVAQANGVYDVTISDPGAQRGEIYFIEYDTAPSFATARRIDNGRSNYWRGHLALGVNSYWRFYKQLEGGNASTPINFGGSVPTLVGFANTAGAGPAPGIPIPNTNGINQPGKGIGPLGAKT